MIIEEMFAFVVLEKPGEEGVPAFRDGSVWVPLIGADWSRVESLRPLAKEMARKLGKPLTLCKFTVREDVEVIEP